MSQEQETQIPVFDDNSNIKKTINIHSLKQFALRLPSSSTLRNVLLGEKDTMTAEEFLAKMETWDNLATLESK